MLFSTQKELREAIATIEERDVFPDLTDDQMLFMTGLYTALDVIDDFEESHCGSESDYDGLLGKIVDEIKAEAAVDIEMDVLNLALNYVAAFRDENAEEETVS